MTYLLDTHVIIWMLFEPKKLSATVQQILTDSANIIIVSAVNFWEISIKYNSGKLGLGSLQPNDLPHLIVGSGYTIENLFADDTSSLFHLTAMHHKDPFDRMLIWIAMNNNYTLISNDENIKLYKKDGLQLIW
jgi:PIN domain nuclease of toxin-antitoxin system